MSNNQSATNKKSRRSPPKVTWKHSWALNETKNALAQSNFRKLPNEMRLHIFKFLPVHDLGNVSLVCRSFKVLADQDEIWKLKTKLSAKPYSKSFKQIYMDWTYEKYLRKMELEKVGKMHGKRSSMGACGMLRRLSTRYPMRPKGEHKFVRISGFKQHPNESQDMTIELSVDVDRTARELISLLEKASQFQVEWRQSHAIKQMITRYYRFMQLKALCPRNILLIPTLDIEIIWQTHLLRPVMYRKDCMRLFHEIIDHSLVTNDIEQFLKEQAFIDTCKLYEERFGEQYCPLPKPKEAAPSLKCLIPIYSYWDETHYSFSTESSKNYDDNPFSFTEADVILDGNRLDLCKNFMKQMLAAIPITRLYNNKSDQIDLGASPLKRLKKSYERFLYMSTKYPLTNGCSFIHSTYAIDIIWHSHMQEPLKYASDCGRLVGYIIDHAPWPSVDEKKMKSSSDDATKAWKNEFQSEMQTDHLYNTIYDGFDE